MVVRLAFLTGKVWENRQSYYEGLLQKAMDLKFLENYLMSALSVMFVQRYLFSMEVYCA
jgi:hypothetical protein